MDFPFTTGTAAVTPIQFRRAQALARAHGHEWGDVNVTVNGEPDPLQDRSSPGTPTVALTLPAPVSEIAAGIEAALDPHRQMPGIGFSVAHTTGTGRLSWEVYASGAVDLWVRRPGSTLCALRALQEAARTAWCGASPDFRAALAGLAGATLECGYIDSDSVLAVEMCRLSRGVDVLHASVGSDSSVEIVEKTRWDTTSDEDAAEFKHWLTLREALAAIGLALPEVRPQVASAFAEYDAALASSVVLTTHAEDARRLQADMLRDLAADDPTHGSLRDLAAVKGELADAAEQRLRRAYSADVGPNAAPGTVRRTVRR